MIAALEPPETPPIQHSELQEDSQVVVARSVPTPTVSRAATSSRTSSSVQSELQVCYVMHSWFSFFAAVYACVTVHVGVGGWSGENELVGLTL